MAAMLGKVVRDVFLPKMLPSRVALDSYGVGAGRSRFPAGTLLAPAASGRHSGHDYRAGGRSTAVVAMPQLWR